MKPLFSEGENELCVGPTMQLLSNGLGQLWGDFIILPQELGRLSMLAKPFLSQKKSEKVVDFISGGWRYFDFADGEKLTKVTRRIFSIDVFFPTSTFLFPRRKFGEMAG